MNLVLVTALIAVCGADKLDRTYLPPPSAKTAGGSPGSLQAPFTRTFNQGLGGIPTGGYNNDFQGVVVDAAAPGTRASGTEQSGLGAPRIAYGSADSKVGDAAFKAQNHNQGQHQPVGTPAGPGSQNFHDIGHLRPERIQAVHDRASNTVKYENEVSNAGFNYAFETDNGIVAEENGISINGVNAQGGFAYTGDDGQVYSVTYTADEGGYQPKGTHLPTPPPIPEEILKSLEQNAKDEASGVIDDGSYDAEKYNTEDDYTKSDTANEKYHGQRPAQFGNQPQADREVGGSLINQNNQGFGTNGNHYDQQPNRDSSDANRFASANSFAKAPQGNNFGFGINRDSNGQIGQNLALNQGSQNEYLPPYNGFNQNSKPTQSARPQDSQYNEKNGFPQVSRPSSHSNVNTPTNKDQEDSKIPDFVPLSQQKLQDDSEVKPQANPISGKPTFVGSSLSVRPPTYTFSGSSPTNAFNQKPVSTGTAGRYEPTSGNVFGSNNEYLPPQSQFNKPGQGNQGDLNASFGTQFNRKPDLNSQSQQSANAGPYTATAFASVSQPNFAGSQQYNGFQQYQTPAGLSQPSQTLPNRFPLNKAPTHFGSAPTNSPVYNRAPVGNGQFKPISLAPHPPTLQPLTELTTPLETNAAQNTVSAPLPVFDGSDSQSLTTSSDLSSFGSPSTSISGQSGINPSNLQKVSPTQASASSFASFNDQSFTSSFPSAPKLGSTGSYSNGQFQASHKPTSDVQYSSSTQSPNFSQYTQQQGPDDSYYYNQPSKPFNIPTGRPQESRFPNPSFDQANRVTPSSSFPSRPQPTGPLTSFTSQGNTASTRYPRPPSLEPTSPTVPSKQADNYYHNQFNRVTQASASSFPSVAPTVSSDFNGNHFPQFDSKPFHLANPQLDDISQFTTNSEVPTNQPSSAFTQAAASSQDPHNQGVDQLSPNTKVESTQDAPSQSPGQKYDGEIYDYKKPPPVLSSPQGPAVGNFGQKPQFGSQSQSSYQDGQSPSTGTYKPNSQFGFKQPQQLSPFGQSQNPQTTQTQAPQSQEQGHIGSIQKPTQNTQLVQGASKFPSTYRPHFVSACCKSSSFPSSQVDQQRRPFNDPATPGLSQAQKPQSPGSQGLKTDSSASSFPGVGENFGGPRKPPSFDESGYHY